MCLGVPLKIVEINGKEAIGEMKTIKRKVRIDFLKEVNIGDYVMVHAGFAIEKIDYEYAREVSQALEDVSAAMSE